MSLEPTEARTLYRASADEANQRRWFTEGAVPVAVYGLGKMGLPVAAVFAEASTNVTGVDIDQQVVDRINEGQCPVDNEPGLVPLVSTTVSAGHFQATADAESAAAAASIHLVIVPTTLADDDTADLSNLRAALEAVGSGLSAGDVVLVESTVPPGTCRDVVAPLLADASGLSVGEFGIAFCPERTASGAAIEDIQSSYPKVVGGIDAESTRTAALIYGEITDNRVITVSDVTTAECVKLFEGAYRDVNIALANELARYADELDVDALEAIEVANTQPYCDIHDPGAGVGGHCIPFYPYFLMGPLEMPTPLLRTSRIVNESMPGFTASKLFEGLATAGIDPDGAQIAILGVAYRPGVAETRESPALPIIERFQGVGLEVIVVDPVIDSVPGLDVSWATVDHLPDLGLDAAVLITAHPEFERIDWSAMADMVVVDGRDALDLDGTGHAVYTIGRGT